MSWKRGWVIVVFLIVILSYNVNAAQPADCNTAGGVWCSSACVYGGEPPTGFGTVDCVVDQLQGVKTNPNKNFVFKTLTIKPTGTLKFYTEMAFGTNAFCAQNAGGEKGTAGSPQEKGKKGGDGGKGGSTCDYSIGGDTGYRESGWQCGGDGAGAPIKLGGVNVSIYAQTLELKGVLNLEGYVGNPGGNAKCHYNPIYSLDDYGFGGGGGSGGSGAGTISIYSVNITGNGKIDLRGGRGGNGGRFNDENGGQCGGAFDKGSGGGGGGGGAGGSLQASSTIPTTININCTGGLGGTGGCHGMAEKGNDGSQGKPIGGSVSACISTNIDLNESNCNDALDNDFDGFIDFEDRDCYKTAVSDNNWSASGPVTFSDLTTIKGQKNPTSTLIFNASSKTGHDGVCGDDGIAVYTPVFSDFNTNSIIDNFDSNSNGWSLSSGATITSGSLKIQNATPENFASLLLEVSNISGKFNISFKNIKNKGYATARITFFDQHKNRINPPANSFSAPHCIRDTTGGKFLIRLSDCLLSGATSNNCPDGVTAACEFEILDKTIPIKFFNITLLGTTHSYEVEYDSFRFKSNIAEPAQHTSSGIFDDLYFFDKSSKYFCSNDYTGSDSTISPNPPANWKWWAAADSAFIIHKILI
ncbi:MAG: hypothetical protein KJ583_00575 [Nanoarchaeota archaeon]|nr:hypothetical protein [Nanoarchaeota archaeon]MBU1269280.1 hypothetical protein [Nanoarchaeota archaeon]MBU1603783.1 hypothetical protein [Nanoarchaeota archaeon]MBU2443908.1 hypothetical protein [Nanoarchaeota archaeon]